MSLFKSKIKKGYVQYYFCGVRVAKIKDEFSTIHYDFSKNRNFDCRDFDTRIKRYIDKNFIEKEYTKNPVDENRIAFLATEFGDMGGHTEVVKTLVSLLADKYEIGTFLVEKDATYKNAPKKIKMIEKHSQIFSADNNIIKINNVIENLFLKIIGYNPKVLFAFHHMDDIVSTSILYMLKKYTNIKVVYFNHGSHCPALGFSFADLIIEAMPTTHFVTKEYRGVDKCCILGLPNENKNEIKYYSQEEIQAEREKLGLIEGNLFTLSGASSYKFFDNNFSEYFEMIKWLLEIETSLKHIVITKLNDSQKHIVNEIFINSKAKNRLKFVDFTSNYDLLFQSCDVFIDSFPISSALTQIDLMKWKKPTVVKINNKNAMFSFHEYFPKDYQYKFDNIEDMKKGILKILYSKQEQQRVTDQLYEHYLQNFEGNKVKDKYIKIIENADNLGQFAEKIDDKLNYKLENIQ